MALIPGLMMSVFLGLSVTTLPLAWVSVELNTFLFLSVIALDENVAPMAPLKYFFVQAVASSVFLLMALLLEVFGSSVFIWGFLSIIFIFKMGAAPFHYWMVDLAKMLSWPGLWWFLGVQKVLPFYYFSQFNSGLSSLCLLGSAVIGAYGAFMSPTLFTLLAYSSVFTLAWMLLSPNILSSLFYLLSYSLSSWVVLSSLNVKNKNPFIFSLTWSQLQTFSLGVGWLSMAGIPPFLGFSAKVVILLDVLSLNIQSLLFVVIQLTVLTLFVYLRVITHMFLGPTRQALASPAAPNSSMLTTLVISGGGLLILILYMSVEHDKIWIY